MKQAILITAYKNFEHLKSLINFFDDDFKIYVHIDTKSIVSNSQISELAGIKNVQLIEKNIVSNGEASIIFYLFYFYAKKL